MASGPITSWPIARGKVEAVTNFLFLGSKITGNGDCSHEIKRCLLLGKENYDNPRQCIKKQRHHFADQSPYSQSYGFSSSCVWMWALDHKEDWTPNNWYFQIVVLERPLESLSDRKEIKRANPKGNQPWIFIGRMMLKLKLQYFGLMQRTDSLERTLMLVKIEGTRRRGRQRMRWLDSITNSMDMSLENFER